MEKRFTYRLKPCHNESVLRITSGLHRGRLIQSLPGLGTRPTSERLRQAWLNALQMRLTDARVLDLFSGSGALGLEAISRGASFVLFVEENAKAAQVIRDNIKALKLEDQTKVLQKRVEQILPLLQNEAPFDFVFLDPPYHQGHEERVLADFPWDTVLTEDGTICIESAHRKEGAFTPPPGLTVSRHERYGDSQLSFYVRSTETRPS